MDLELCLDPDDATRFLRLPLLAAATKGGSQAQRIVWHDSADAALTAAGLALALEGGVWRLERLVPRTDDVWPPGAPPPVLAEAASVAELGHALPEAIAPVVAFAGRRRTLAISTEHGAVALTLLRGTMRAVTAEHPAARVRLSGEERAVLQLALALAGAVRVWVPTATLAGEALAAARALAPAPRRAGFTDLPPGLPIAAAFGFAAGHLTDVMLHHAPAAAADHDGPEPVHQMRVALRRLRSAVTVFRPVLDCPELQAAAAGLKALSARLGPTRDWDVFLGETLPAVQAMFPEEKRLRQLEAAAARRRQACHAALRAFLDSAAFRQMGIELAWLAGARCWHPQPPEDAVEAPPALTAFATDVLSRRIRKLQTDADMATLDAPALHVLRLKAKRARYAVELFAPLYPGKGPRRFIQRLTAMQDGLGTMNDRTTAAHLLAELGGPGGRHGYAAGLVLGFTAAGAADVLPRVIRRWHKLHRTGKFWQQA